MDFAGYHYYKLTHKLLIYLGLWNMEARWPEKIRRFYSLFCPAISVLIQVAALFANENDLHEFSKSLIFIISWYTFIDKYFIFYIHMDKVRTLLYYVQYDWNQLQNTDEFNILEKYTKNGTVIRTVFMTNITLISWFIIIFECLPFTVKENHVHKVLKPFIDGTGLYSICYLFASIATTVGLLTVIATETFLVMLALHCCAMFKIIGYRIRCAINEKKKYLVYAKLIEAVLLHRRVIEYIDITNMSFATSYFVLLVLGLISITMNLYNFLEAVLVTQNVLDLVESAIYLGFVFFYISMCNYLGQMLIDHSSNIFTETYDTQWYVMPISAQKLIILIMRRSMNYSTIKLGKVYTPSYEGFSTLCNILMTYLLFLCSLHQ